jgi:hypothetical protein
MLADSTGLGWATMLAVSPGLGWTARPADGPELGETTRGAVRPELGWAAVARGFLGKVTLPAGGGGTVVSS